MPVNERLTASEQGAIREYDRELTSPLLFLSSEGTGWEGLTVHAYHEPKEMEGWLDPVIPDIAMVFLTRGTMLMEQQHRDGSWRAQPIRQGDIILKPGGSVTNELRWRSLSSEAMQSLHLHLSMHVFAQIAQEIADCDPAHLTLFGRSGFQDPLLMQIGLALMLELDQPTTAGKLYAQTAAQMLAVHLLRSYTTPTLHIKESLPQLTRQQLKRVIDFIVSHLNQELSLSMLAQQIGFSPYHFARLFHQTTGESPHQFVLRQRIEHAKYLLGNENFSLTQVSVESGFSNQSHLTQVFKRYVGLTPSTYRKQREIDIG